MLQFINATLNHGYRAIHTKSFQLASTVAAGAGIVATTAYTAGKYCGPAIVKFVSDTKPFLEKTVDPEMFWVKYQFGFSFSPHSIMHYLAFGSMGVVGMGFAACIIGTVTGTMMSQKDSHVACAIWWLMSHISMGLSLSTLFASGVALTPGFAVSTVMIGCVVGLSYLLSKRLLQQKSDWQFVLLGLTLGLALAPMGTQVALGVVANQIIGRACLIGCGFGLCIIGSSFYTAMQYMSRASTLRLKPYEVPRCNIEFSIPIASTQIQQGGGLSIDDINGIKEILLHKVVQPPKCILLNSTIPEDKKKTIAQSIANHLGPVNMFKFDTNFFTKNENMTSAQKAIELFEDLRAYIKDKNNEPIVVYLPEASNYMLQGDAIFGVFLTELGGINVYHNSGMVIIASTNKRLDKAMNDRFGFKQLLEMDL